MSGETDAPQPTPVEPAQPEVGRRRFLELATAGLGLCAGGSVLGVVGAAIVGTPMQGEGGGERWVDLGPLTRFPEGEPIKVSVEGEQRDAWNRLAARSLGRVLVRRTGETVEVLSSVCPHNGCDVFVKGDHFLCPCHDSVFGFDGVLKGGKSPRGLDPLEARIVGKRVEIHFVRYQVGTSERKPI